MKDKAFLPVGTENNHEMKLVKKGDVLLLVDGTKITFTEMKRVKFWGKIGKQENFTIVPIWRNRSQNKPFVTEILGRDESVITKTADIKGFTPGELFSLEGHKETFMYKGKTFKGSRERVAAIDVASGRGITIDLGFTFIKIDIEELKEKHV